MKTLLTVVGNRPQFIKLAPVCKAFRQEGRLKNLLIHTGQHYDKGMSEVFFKELNLPCPDYNLGIGSGPHGRQTGRMMEATEKLLLRIRPDCVIVYGDTNSTLAGALAAKKLHIPVAHIEAGLRSFNQGMPEEINRVVTDTISDFLFAPTETAVKNLLNEGASSQRVYKVGDVMFDAARFFERKAARQRNLPKKLGLARGNYVLSTIHRAENTEDPRRLRAIFGGLGLVAETIPVVIPLHPRTKSALRKMNGVVKIKSGLQVINPVGYLDMIQLEKNARLIVTDSGGVQKEAFFYRVPCVTLREETEWIELVRMGWNITVPPLSAEMVARAILKNLDTKGKRGFPYGYGNASGKIAGIIKGVL